MKPAVLVIALSLLSPFAAAAQEAQEAGRLVAIQQRKFRLAHELEIGGMFEPLDAYSKGVGIEGSYTLHLDDAWSWEVVRAGYVARLDTSLRTQLLRDFGVEPTAFESLQYYAATSAIYAPLYGKFALRNASLVHLEMFLSAGAAFGHFTTLYAAGPELGVGARVFLSQTMSIRLDARDAYFIARKRENVLFFSLGLSVNLGGND